MSEPQIARMKSRLHRREVQVRAHCHCAGAPQIMYRCIACVRACPAVVTDGQEMVGVLRANRGAVDCIVDRSMPEGLGTDPALSNGVLLSRLPPHSHHIRSPWPAEGNNVFCEPNVDFSWMIGCRVDSSKPAGLDTVPSIGCQLCAALSCATT